MIIYIALFTAMQWHYTESLIILNFSERVTACESRYLFILLTLF